MKRRRSSRRRRGRAGKRKNLGGNSIFRTRFKRRLG